MSHQRVDGGAAGRWLQRGWNLFTRSVGLWIVLALLLGIILLVLNFVPLLGGLVGALLMPALFGGLVYGARELDRGRALEFAHLFQAFREPGRAGPMLMLGLVPLGAAVVTGLLAAGVMSGAAGAGMGSGSSGMGSGSSGMGMGVTAGGGMLMMLISLLIGLVSGALLLFSIPRVMFGLDAPMAAIQASFRAVLDNIAAYIVLAIIYFVLAIVAAIPFGLGFLVLMPVMAGAVYAAHDEVFADPAAAAASAAG